LSACKANETKQASAAVNLQLSYYAVCNQTRFWTGSERQRELLMVRVVSWQR